MTKEEAIALAIKHNNEQEDGLFGKIRYIAMEEDGTWHGSFDKPKFDRDMNCWDWPVWSQRLQQHDENFDLRKTLTHIKS